jgi:hypothetical protein
MTTEAMPPEHPEAEARSLVCGSCQWFMSGFNGQNCQVTRSVELTTKACREYTLPLNDPLNVLVFDKYIIGVRTELSNPKYNVDKNIVVELKTYVEENANLLKFSFGSKQDLEGIATFLRRIVALRSRVSTIYTSLVDIKHDFEEVVEYANVWLFSKYAIFRELKNETARKLAFNRILPEMIVVRKNISKAITIAQYVDERLDANERTLGKILSSAEKLWFSKER